VIKPLPNIDNVYHQKMMSNLYLKFNNEIDRYVKTILENNVSGVMPPLLVDNNKNIVVEFSSLNIAKPFHMGHLRSTIIGNCIANINSFLQNQVTKINYLGDWGTQFGCIYLGLQLNSIDIKMEKDPIETLYKVYVKTNSLIEEKPEVQNIAMKFFRKLELEGDNIIYENWQTIKHITVQELEKTYKRLGISFDRYDWESMYTVKNMTSIINRMKEMNLITLDGNKRTMVRVNKNKHVPILKSDGTSLYISRDIAAAIDRYERNKFDAMYYVVDISQSAHFISLIEILNAMELPWANRLKHVAFAKLCGMSTRKGKVIFLKDVLNNAKKCMKSKQLLTSTTKVDSSDIDKTADILATSGVIIQDLKQNKLNSYSYDLQSMFQINGDCGTKLQYTHCRLCSLKNLCNNELVTECDPSLLKEPAVDLLITMISQFDEVVLKCYEQLEPCILTIYLFKLCKVINNAFNKLNINKAERDIGNQRLLLFYVAKCVLAQGMKLLGLIPLKKM
ncbi:putative arginine--tRNA ligase, mitochondrial, partial [Eufriesea mexicana]